MSNYNYKFENSPEDSGPHFNVVLIFANETHHYEARNLMAEAAVKLAYEVSKRPAALVGIIGKILITDGGDFTVFEWQFGKGVTFPPLPSKS